MHIYRGSIRAIEFSDCGEFLATVDTDRCVSVFRTVQSQIAFRIFFLSRDLEGSFLERMIELKSVKRAYL